MCKVIIHGGPYFSPRKINSLNFEGRKIVHPTLVIELGKQVIDFTDLRFSTVLVFDTKNFNFWNSGKVGTIPKGMASSINKDTITVDEADWTDGSCVATVCEGADT